LDDLVQLIQGDLTHGAFIKEDMDDAVNLLWGRRRPKIRTVPLAASGLLGLVAPFRPAKGMSLAMGIALRLVELLAEAMEFRFQFSDAAIALLTAGTDRTRRSHDAFPKIG
jgi:hypothetical protein